MRYYFFKTCKVEGRPRLRPLPGQTDDNGRPVNHDLNVQADSIMRGSYPLGTVFGSDTLELKTHSATMFYSAGAIYPLGLKLTDYIVQSHVPSQDMSDAWVAFQLSMSSQMSQQAEPGEPEGPTLLDSIKTDVRYAIPTIDADGFFVCEDDWHLIVRNIVKRVNTMMIGPTGTGKTEIIMLACRKLGIDCSVYDMGSMYDPISELLGVHRMTATPAGVVSSFEYSKFTQDIQKPGVIILDELSRAPVTTNNILFPCLDSRRCLPVEMAGVKDTRTIPVHPECVFFATANLGLEYVGTQELDRALSGRFLPMEMNYMPEAEEAMVLSRRTGISIADAQKVARAACSIREYRDREQQSDIPSISTRETLMAGAMVADGWSVIQALQKVFLPLYDGTLTTGSRSIINNLLMAN